MNISTHHLYENNPNVTLTTYIHEDSPELIPGTKRPAILILPGGGYFGCSAREGEMVALRFASMGYHTSVLKYTTYFDLDEKQDLKEMHLSVRMDKIYPRALHDIGAAMIYLRKNADQWLLDGDRIVLLGFSAGGHNCAMYATHWNQKVLTEHFNTEAENLKPQAVILGYPITDFVELRDQGILIKNSIWESLFVALLGNNHPSEEELYRISPAKHVTENTSPMFIWTTSEDNLVPASQSLIMAKALADNGIPFECHVFEHGMHGLSLATQATSQAKSQILQVAGNWVVEVGHWLESRFPLDLPELTHWEEN